jgi:hypothetical protein
MPEGLLLRGSWMDEDVGKLSHAQRPVKAPKDLFGQEIN